MNITFHLCRTLISLFAVGLVESLFTISAINCVFGGGGYKSLRRKYFQLGPKRSPKYNPNYAYEPYWPEGDWVFQRLDTTTERRPGLACGVECSGVFEEFGEICGRSYNYTHKTFKNYCELLNEDCKGGQKWLIIYRGKCQGGFKLLQTNQLHMASRAQKYIDDFEESNPPMTRYKG